MFGFLAFTCFPAVHWRQEFRGKIDLSSPFPCTCEACETLCSVVLQPVLYSSNACVLHSCFCSKGWGKTGEYQALAKFVYALGLPKHEQFLKDEPLCRPQPLLFCGGDEKEQGRRALASRGAPELHC